MMSFTAIAIIAGLLVTIVGWSYILHRRSGRPLWQPLWTAFTLTAVALIYGSAGLMGYVVPSHNPFIDHPPAWVGHVVWPQVAWAVVTSLVSVFFWWHGLKRLSR
jgi:hypothetical protein